MYKIPLLPDYLCIMVHSLVIVAKCKQKPNENNRFNTFHNNVCAHDRKA